MLQVVYDFEDGINICEGWSSWRYVGWGLANGLRLADWLLYNTATGEPCPR